MTQQQAPQQQQPHSEQPQASSPPGEQPPPKHDAAPERARGTLTASDALTNLADLADLAMKTVRGSVDDLPLPAVVDALELLIHNLETVHQMVTAVNQRAAQIREREVTERSGGTALATMDSALVTLSYGQETVMATHRLLSLGFHELVRLVDEEV